MSGSYAEILIAVFLLILPFLYESSHVFKYYFKFFVYYGIVMAYSVVLIPVFSFNPGDVRNLVRASNWCRPVSHILGIRWSLRGKPYFEKDEACIIVSNHQSSLDIMGMFQIWPVMDKCTVVAKRELLYAWPFGLAAWLCGLIFIPRMNPCESITILNKAVEKIRQTKTKLWVFPEGTRRNTGQIHPFKKGAFHMALSSKLPIMPVVFSQYYFLDKNIKRFESGQVIITALPRISTENMTTADIDSLMENVRNQMMTTFTQVNKELRNSIRANVECF